MTFWSSQKNKMTNPKFKFRWQVAFSGGNGGVGAKPASFAAKSVSKPSFEVSSEEHKYLNHTFKYPGRLSWDAVSVTLVDPGGDEDTAKALAQIIKDSGYHVPNSDTDVTTITKKKALDALGTVTITQYSGEDAIGEQSQVLEQWTLHNAWISKVGFGDLSYDDEGLSEVELELQYDWATLEAGGPDASSKFFARQDT